MLLWNRKTPRFWSPHLLFLGTTMVGSVAAVTITEHSCYTGLPAAATSMNCGNKGLTGAYSSYYPTRCFYFCCELLQFQPFS